MMDRKIISTLENARTPKTKIAQMLGISETTVRRRITSLMEGVKRICPAVILETIKW